MEATRVCFDCEAYCCGIPFAFGVSLLHEELQFYEKKKPGCTNGCNAIKFSPKCPFLNEENHCSIYDERPEACKQFMCWALKDLAMESYQQEQCRAEAR